MTYSVFSMILNFNSVNQSMFVYLQLPEVSSIFVYDYSCLSFDVHCALYSHLNQTSQ